ncbi:MAG: hypothetical protein ACRCWR_00525 [Saezia sp.]
MSDLKPKIPSGLIFRSLLIFWMIVLTYFVFENLRTTGKLLHAVSSEEKTQAQQALTHRLNTLQDQLIALQENQKAQHSAVEKVNQATQDLALTVNVEFQKFAPHKALNNLSRQFSEMQDAIKALQEVQTLRATALPVSPVNAAPPKETATRILNQTPPFKVIGLELRAGENLLSVMPAGQNSISAIRLIRLGQAIGSWTLQSIDSGQAIFKSGAQVRRLPIPN